MGLDGGLKGGGGTRVPTGGGPRRGPHGAGRARADGEWELDDGRMGRGAREPTGGGGPDSGSAEADRRASRGSVAPLTCRRSDRPSNFYFYFVSLFFIYYSSRGLSVSFMLGFEARPKFGRRPGPGVRRPQPRWPGDEGRARAGTGAAPLC